MFPYRNSKSVVKMIVPAAFVFVALLSLSCTRSKPASQSQTAVKTPASATDIVQPPARSSSRLDESFLKEQSARSESFKRELAGLKKSANGDTAQIKRLTLHRKGEVLAAMKRVRLDPALTQAEKDSLIRVLESESMDLSQQLIAVQK
jgi:hypothetical protein